ncbi:hypothetical protein KFK09_017921 [Dendrobium nobile]|uniref:Uncharacterized protein n=1 Tax=Dendrobium nobile TaxID=94219 RepID=A0A8T3ATD5_DENNO|nr:hypothetical protein KFK09_017921 [Dendrobium nobile]
MIFGSGIRIGIYSTVIYNVSVSQSCSFFYDFVLRAVIRLFLLCFGVGRIKLYIIIK